MTVIEKGIWKGWDQTPLGFKKTFEKKYEVTSIGGDFYVEGLAWRFNTLKECLEWARKKVK